MPSDRQDGALDLLNGLFRPPVRWTQALRIEVRGGYASDLHDHRLAYWWRTGRVRPQPDRPWYMQVRQLTSEGRRVRRVRVVDSPPIPGQRFLRALAQAGNIPAGEEIRELPRVRADELRLHHDVWLFEGPEPTAATLLFGTADELLGISVSRNPADITAARERWAAAWATATVRP